MCVFIWMSVWIYVSVCVTTRVRYNIGSHFRPSVKHLIELFQRSLTIGTKEYIALLPIGVIHISENPKSIQVNMIQPKLQKMHHLINSKC